MKLQKYVTVDNKKLRCGYTTGSCASGASKAALYMLFSGETVNEVPLTTPDGTSLTMEITDIHKGENNVSCAVIKDAGDDPDVTNGMKIFAEVSLAEEKGVLIDGGRGIGRVTKPGLDQPVGNAAINSVPRKMITRELMEVCRKFGYTEGVRVVISAPDGEERAKKTFNPRLGITGGISILGTTGIVEPMSDAAIIATIKTEIRQKKAMGCIYAVITPGNLGESFVNTQYDFKDERAIKCSNFIGETFDFLCEEGFQGALLIGHIGKLVKLAGNMMNTHSRYGDCRAEIFAAHAAVCGMSMPNVKEIMNAATTDEMLRIAKTENLAKDIADGILKKAWENINFRTAGKIKAGIAAYSFEDGVIGAAGAAEEIARKLKEKE